MKLNRELGFYIPAFFMMQVDVDESIEEIIDTMHERVFSHELIHFLQDITTTYGLINICKCIDVIKAQNQALINKDYPVSLPLGSCDLNETVMANVDLFSLYVGDDAEKFKAFPESYIVTDIIEDEMEVDLVSYPVKYFNVKYESQVFTSTEIFHFGSMAIYESMANLIESEIYGEESRCKNFPYDSALMIADYLCPNISHNRLAICELCEASLMYYNPAEVFVASLKKLNEFDLVFEEPNEYYLYVLRNFKLETNSAKSEFVKASKLAMSQLNDLFTVSPFTEEKWASSMVFRAEKLRGSDLSLSARLWGMDKNKSREVLMSFIKSIGMPIVFNGNFDAWVRDSEEHLYTPLMHQAILSFHEILRGKQLSCSLHAYCAKNNSGDATDCNCQSAPWLRLEQGKSCYFSNLWKMWGLENVQILVDEV
ncbi:hypothetical protein [Escherichia coli]|uniref:hypothetical protein n=1 Tax=Escherichia coli TaxID=562 RepID=UPI0034C63519